ncbi:sn-glycerol-3-phosphate ABC transporter ATP-binding protein UgpC [Sphingomonas aliaeris]|uniref:Sn-glycerol-3-phosphate ABC transporter ATP-binding protein UgpC n=1 Tax=Sphingomonas aliaeris TaxID=2759526 RepID=A0A974S532_9SPHN|nr:sn-glycerol-3-phosphate ABC transporter ATP-binding protein UgpC [Sphingomonas aliaeris]QQV77635.1 sn-glycerol-3-phosphate ABC transporter ATP-binding protein UgpC [Sphingomonas aliaeris]
MPASLELRDIRKDYAGKQIIKGVSLSVAPSEFLVLVGPSGCGKSTLLRMIAGLEEISSGDLYFDDQRVNDWDPARRRIGMVFQSYALYPHMTVAENIGFGLKLAKKPRAEREQRVDEALRILQLESLRDAKPSQLSGGQRQRVAIGRAIVRKPNAFLFDEPLSNLDAALRIQMRMEIGRLHQRLQNTVVYVTHDQVEAMTLADRIVVLEGGVIRQVGVPLDLYRRPANRFVAGFIGTPTMGFLSVMAIAQSADGLTVELPGPADTTVTVTVPFHLDTPPSGESMTLGIRPEHCHLVEPDDGLLSGTVIMLERLGADTFAFLDLPGSDGTVAVRLTERDGHVASGDHVGFAFDAAQTHLFHADGQALSPIHG